MRGRKASSGMRLPRAPYVREVHLKRAEVPSFDAYPFSLPAVRGLSRLALHPRVTFLVGENGSGKSTLLEAIAIAWGMNAEGGGRNFAFATRESHSNLAEYLLLLKEASRPNDGFFLRAESFFNLATEVDRLDATSYYGGRSLHEQSHGESFLSLFLHRFVGFGFYLLDEPEAALSPTRQMSMVRRLHHLVQLQSQFIIATHSPIIMAYPDARIIHLSPDGIESVDYKETEHYFVTREFLSNPERMLRVLLDDAIASEDS